MKYILNDKSKNIIVNLSHETFKLKYVDKKGRNRNEINNETVLSEEQWTKGELWVTFFSSHLCSCQYPNQNNLHKS